MAEIKWIKITTDMFDNRKIKHLRKLPEGNNIVLIWVMLLTMAGRCNAGGMIFLTENIPYTPKMLADELGFEENTVKLALQFLEQFNMRLAAAFGGDNIRQTALNGDHAGKDRAPGVLIGSWIISGQGRLAVIHIHNGLMAAVCFLDTQPFFRFLAGGAFGIADKQHGCFLL